MNLKELINKEVSNFSSEQDGFKKFPKARFTFTKERAEEFSRVTVEQLIDDPYFLSLKWSGNQGLYPALKDAILELEEERKKRIVNTFIFTGSVGSGKSNKYNSLCVTNKGILTMEESFNDIGVTHLVAESGFKPVENKIEEGEQDGIEIILNNGLISHNTPHHKLRVWTEDAEIEWKYVRDIKVGDYVVIAPNVNEVWGTRTEIDGLELTEKRCEVLGLWVAEGRQSSTNVIEIISGEERKELDELFSDAEIKFNHERIITNAHHYKIYSTFASIVIKYFKSGSSNKSIPQFIREMPKHLIVAFLRGMFAGDGSFQTGAEGRGTITYSTVSKELIEQVCVLLTYLGIKFLYSEDNRTDRENYKTCYNISIRSNRERIKFKNAIGTIFSRRINALNSCCYNDIREKSRIDAVPYTDKLGIDYFSIPIEYRSHSYKGNSEVRSMFRKIRNGFINSLNIEFLLNEPYDILPDILKEIYEKNYWLVPVKSIEHKKTRMYDFTIENDPSYISGGFISHNTSLASVITYIEMFRLLTLPNPQAYYGMTDDSDICFIMLSRDENKSKKVTFRKILPLFANSPAINDYFPAHIDFSKISDNPRTFPSELRFPKHVLVFPGSSSAAAALGFNAHGGVVDESNDFEVIEKSKKNIIKSTYDAAAETVNEILNRMNSRFPWEHLHRQGKHHGICCLIGQTRGPDSFLERKIREAEVLGNDSTVFWIRKSLWEAQPKERFSSEKFLFDTTNSKVIEFVSKDEQDLSESTCAMCKVKLKKGAYIGNNGKLVCSLECYENSYFQNVEIVS